MRLKTRRIANCCRRRFDEPAERCHVCGRPLVFFTHTPGNSIGAQAEAMLTIARTIAEPFSPADVSKAAREQFPELLIYAGDRALWRWQKNGWISVVDFGMHGVRSASYARTEKFPVPPPICESPDADPELEPEVQMSALEKAWRQLRSTMHIEVPELQLSIHCREDQS